MLNCLIANEPYIRGTMFRGLLMTRAHRDHDDMGDLNSVVGNGAIGCLERVRPIVRADRTMHVVYERTDVAEMTCFLRDFGLISVATTEDGVSYFRGHGTPAYVVAIVPSNQDRFAGFAVSVAKASAHSKSGRY